ncbi:MAG: N(4)-(beta-N-acetylglucosaminyl)-L-asparaginase [Capsulimonadales bacterium]|nr:N(4)-(beta-N-acetylglucosaminyl)-L-asparaginase [Capsulimonadales bacterium]
MPETSLIRPVIVTTWPFGRDAAETGFRLLAAGGTALDAVERAANVTELDPTVSSVGYGGLPNADGVVELDAAIMDGRTHAAGSVAGLTGVRCAISVARRVMERTPHVLLVGDNARRFAQREGFPAEETLSPVAADAYADWQQRRSGPEVAHFTHGETAGTPEDHDTIGLCALDRDGNLAVGCTTSGMAWKVPGRVGDSPIIGSGLYVDNAVGAVSATGHGDEMMKACLAYRAVLLMEQGFDPTEACAEAIRYLLRKRPPEQHGRYGAALIALRKDGAVGAAASESGFDRVHGKWNWCVATDDGVTLREGPYVA